MTRRQSRNTRQRTVVLEALRAVRSHPTALEVYDMVRQSLPTISLGTVYRNLEHLEKEGLIRRLDVGGSQRRYDACVEEHTHIRCLECGRVDDVPLHRTGGIATLFDGIARCTGYDVRGCEIDFVGLCPRCTSHKEENKE